MVSARSRPTMPTTRGATPAARRSGAARTPGAPCGPGCGLPRDLDAKVRAALEDWADRGKVGRLWARDPTLWTGRGEARWLGWLGIVDQQLGRLDEFRRAAEDVRQAGLSHVLLLGMGGSSLCPEVLKLTFGRIASWPELHVLD